MKLMFYVVLLVVSGISTSDTAIQTDWSGGSGVPGPVPDWENCYDTGDQVADDTAGSLCLEKVLLVIPAEYVVDWYFNTAFSVYASDVDGDGDTDVLGAAPTAKDITWWENTDGFGTSWNEHKIDGLFDGARSIYASDLDGDGDTDVLGAAYADDEITWWENMDGSGTVWIEHVLDGSYDYAASVYASDVDGDGDTDVLGAAAHDDDITWWENTGGSSTLWTKHTVDGSFDGALAVHASDIDGDGDTDVLGAAHTAHEIAWWENANGSGTSWTEHTVDNFFDGACSVYASDVDGDGDIDVLGAAVNADEITWWENTDGSGSSWTEHLIHGSVNGARAVHASDLDGDGDIDVLGAAANANQIWWWENTDGSGTSWLSHLVVGQFSGVMSVYASDVDGDGIADVLGASYSDDVIAWWKVAGFSSGDLESSILNAGAVGDWEMFNSSESEPAGTSVGFQFRSSDDYADMGSWSDTVFTTSADLSAILADFTDYFQYRVILQTMDPMYTPLLQDVTVSYSISESVEGGSWDDCWDLALASNPSYGGCSILVSVLESGPVSLTLHDITGRIASESAQELPAGIHSIFFGDLPMGVYFCTMSSGEFAATERITLLK